MKHILIGALLLVATAVSAQTTPTTFPRKNVIEHFTGDQCGYCPEGMNAISEYVIDRDTTAIWVSHHYGYNTDEYTISASSKIGKMLGVSGAPTISINRKKYDYGQVFQPTLLSRLNITDTTTVASVVIEHTYDAETRQLDMTVSGVVLDTTVEQYLLTILIKENRLVGEQADYTTSWKTATWKEYMHARVVRDYVTHHFGDTVMVTNQSYSRSYSYTVDNNWVAENCCVVAYLTPMNKKPVVNAEQVALVAGTTGGEEYYPYGITEGVGPNSSVSFDSLIVNKVDDDLMEIQLFSSKSIKTASGSCKTVGLVYLNTEADSLQAGTYPIQDDGAMGSITAGYRIDEQRIFGGSILVYAQSSYLAHGDLRVAHMWRMNSGEMIVDEKGNITLAFKTYGGAKVSTAYTKSDVAVDNVIVPENLVQKVWHNGTIIILKDSKEYNMLGTIIR